MSCKQTATLLPEYLDNGLPVLRREQLDAHLQGCPRCREELEALRAVNAELLQWRDQDVPEWSRVPQAGHKPVVEWLTSWRWWQWAPLATAMVLVLAVVFNLQLIRHNDGFTVAFGNQSSRLEGSASEQVQRPDIDALRQSLALTIDDGTPGRSANESWQEVLDTFEQSLFGIICANGARLQGLPDEALTIVLPGLGRADGNLRGDRIHVIGKADMQSCASGSISAVELQGRAAATR